MARRNQNTFLKRQKEIERVRKAKEKMDRRQGKKSTEDDLYGYGRPVSAKATEDPDGVTESAEPSQDPDGVTVSDEPSQDSDGVTVSDEPSQDSDVEGTASTSPDH